MAKTKKIAIGQWAFSVAAVVAILAALIQPIGDATITWVLVILGIVVGLLNITAKEETPFLVASIALVLTLTSLSILPALGLYIQAMFMNIAVFVSPAAVVVALKAVYKIAAKR